MPTKQKISNQEAAQALKALRAATGMKQKEFAEYFDMSYGTYTGWEAGRFAIPEMTLKLMRLKLESDGFVEVQRKREVSLAPYNSIAEWKRKELDDGTMGFVCSKCGGKAGWFGGYNSERYPFCPHCGRKMRNPDVE